MTHATATVREALLGAEESPLVVAQGPAVAQMFGTVSPNVSDADVATVLELLVGLVTEEAEPAELRELVRDEELDPVLSPADHGYALALEVLERIGALEDEWVDVERILDRLGVRRPVLELSDPKIRGLAVAGERFAPAAAVNAAYPWTTPEVKRASLAHELCHLLFDRSRGRRVAVASGPWAPLDIERRAGAFAAMFLMPISAVRRAVSDVGRIGEDWESVRAVAERLRTSASTTLEHLHNLGFIDDLDYDRLRDLDARRRLPRQDDDGGREA
jgi:Zn-dependent peptidase ImmA (M78 family)